MRNWERFALLLCSDQPLLLSTVPSSEPWTGLGVRSDGRCEHLLPGKKNQKKKKPRRHLVFLVLQQFSVWTAALWSRKIIHLPKWDGCLFHLWKKTSFASLRISQQSLDHQKQTGINIQSSPLVTNISRHRWNQQADEVVWGYPDADIVGK